MPLMFVHYTAGTFDQDSLDALANQITKRRRGTRRIVDDRLRAEHDVGLLPRVPPHPRLPRGQNGGTKDFVSVQINVIQGGYSESTKKQLIQRVTDAVDKYAHLPTGEPRGSTC